MLERIEAVFGSTPPRDTTGLRVVGGANCRKHFAGYHQISVEEDGSSYFVEIGSDGNPIRGTISPEVTEDDEFTAISPDKLPGFTAYVLQICEDQVPVKPN